MKEVESFSRLPGRSETCRESVLDTQGVLGPQKACENGRHGRREVGQKGVLGSRGLAGRASWAPEACREAVVGAKRLPGASEVVPGGAPRAKSGRSS